MSLRPIMSTGKSPSRLKAWRSNCCIQVFSTLALRQRGRFASKVRSAASRKVGTLTLRFAASGSPPLRASFRFWNALSRASAKLTSG